jgi:uncharacterized protein YgiM (DUF1202 family)
MRASLGDENARVWQEPTTEAISITSINKGDEFEVGKVIRKKKETWVTITLDNGVTGYIPGDTHIFAIQTVEAIGNDIEVRESASDESPILIEFPKKTAFIVRGAEKVDDDTWYRVEDSEGVTGYMKAGPRLRVRPQVTAQSARKMMITGGIFTAAGVLMYFIFPAPVDSPDTGVNFITLAIILLGLFQVFQGFMQYRQVNKK